MVMCMYHTFYEMDRGWNSAVEGDAFHRATMATFLPPTAIEQAVRVVAVSDLAFSLYRGDAVPYACIPGGVGVAWVREHSMPPLCCLSQWLISSDDSEGMQPTAVAGE